MSLPTWLDDLLRSSVGSLIPIRWLGTPITPERVRLNFAGAGVTVADNAGTETTDVTIAGVGAATYTAPIVSTGGATPVVSITPATDAAAGSMSAADKAKLDTVGEGAYVAAVTTPSALLTVTPSTVDEGIAPSYAVAPVSHTYAASVPASASLMAANADGWAACNAIFAESIKSLGDSVYIGGGILGIHDDSTVLVVLSTSSSSIEIGDSVTTTCSVGGTITDVAAGAEMSGRVGGQPWVAAIPDYDGQSVVQFAKSHTSIKVAIEQKDSGAGATYQVGPHLGASGSLSGNTVLHGGPLVGGVSARLQLQYNTNSTFFEVYRDNANTRYVVENGLFFFGPGALRADFASATFNANYIETNGLVSSAPEYTASSGAVAPDLTKGGNYHIGVSSGSPKLTGDVSISAPTGGRPGATIRLTFVGNGTASITSWNGVYVGTTEHPLPVGVLANNAETTVDFYSRNGTLWICTGVCTYVP